MRMPAQSDEAKAFSTSPPRYSDPPFGIYSLYRGEHFKNIIYLQVQNLTPQLVNAGTIKMTYPENKVLLSMMARIISKTVFKDDVGHL